VITEGIKALQAIRWRYPGNAQASELVYNKYIEYGLTDIHYDSGYYGRNVVATIQGRDHPKHEILVGGHFDSICDNCLMAPGADDNASGTIAVMEIARVLKLIGYHPSRTLRFIGFDAEENGLVGSNDYAIKAKQNGDDIELYLNYDMIGYRKPDQTDYEFIVIGYPGSEAFANLYGAMANNYTILSPLVRTFPSRSGDSYTFYYEGYNALFCTERYINPHYHTMRDSIQYLDIAYIREIIKAGVATILTLDKLPPSVTYLNVYDRGDGYSILVKWKEISGNYQYKISVGDSSGQYSRTFITENNQYLIDELSPGKKYYFGVSTMDTLDQESVIVEKTAAPDSIPLPPVELNGECVQNGVKLYWSRNLEMDILGYNIYRSMEPDWLYSKININPCTDTTYLDTTLISGFYYLYHITAVDSAGNESQLSDKTHLFRITEVGDFAQIPPEFSISQSYPNPQNPTSTIIFELPKASRVMLSVYNTLGQQVATLIDEQKQPGRYEVKFDGSKLPSGVYFYRIVAGEFVETKKMLLLR
jgi:hypothetical protein